MSKTLEISNVNDNGQVLIRGTGQSSASHGNQKIYQIACSHCGVNYGANGCDFWERKCPDCQGGQPGEPLRINI